MAGEPDWNAVAQHVRHKLELELARHPQVGAALSFAEGEKLISGLSNSIVYDVHRMLDPTYDSQPNPLSISRE